MYEEKAFDKIQDPFILKTLNKLGIERFNLIKSIYKAVLQITSYLGAQHFLTKIKCKARMFSLTTAFPHCTGSLANAIKQENEIQYVQIVKEKIKLSLQLP